MPTIAEAAEQLAADGVPVFFLDTCVLLDVIRTPLRKIPRCIESAAALSNMQARSACRMVASSMIRMEWEAHAHAVCDEMDRHFEARDQDALAFHEACSLMNIPLTFGKPTYQAVGLVDKLRDLAGELLKNALHLAPTDETKIRATNRLLEWAPPARKGVGGPQDCIIIEEYFELSRQLQIAGFTSKKVFSTSNTKDYQDGPKLHERLVSEFAAVGLVYTNQLHWAVKDLQTS